MKVKNQQLSLFLVIALVLAIVAMAVVAVPSDFTAEATGSNNYAVFYFPAYSADTSPSNDNVERYYIYLIEQSYAQTLLETTDRVTFDVFKEWVNDDILTNAKKIIQAGVIDSDSQEYFTNYDQYYFCKTANQSPTITGTNDGNFAFAFIYYLDMAQNVEAFMLIGCDPDFSDYYYFDDQADSAYTEWEAVPVDYALTIFSAYEDDDTPSVNNIDRYSAYYIQQTDAQTLLGTTETVTYSSLATWLDDDYETNKANFLSSAKTLTKDPTYTDSTYRLKDYAESAPQDLNNANAAICVVFYTNEDKEAYTVLSHNSAYSSVCAYYLFSSTGTNKVDWKLATTPETYLDENNQTQTTTGKITVLSDSSSAMEWNGGWYVVNDDVTISEKVSVKEDTNLLIKSGKTLTINKSDGSALVGTEGKTLTVYSDDSDLSKAGVLNVKSGQAGGWGQSGIRAMNLTVSGGVILVQGGDSPTATSKCGMGYDGKDATLKVLNGRVTIKSGNCGNSQGYATDIKNILVSNNGQLQLLGGTYANGTKESAINAISGNLESMQVRNIFSVVAGLDMENGGLNAKGQSVANNLIEYVGDKIMLKQHYIACNYGICRNGLGVNSEIKEGTYPLKTNGTVVGYYRFEKNEDGTYKIFSIADDGSESPVGYNPMIGEVYTINLAFTEFNWKKAGNYLYQEHTGEVEERFLLFFKRKVKKTLYYYFTTDANGNPKVTTTNPNTCIAPVYSCMEHDYNYIDSTTVDHYAICKRCGKYAPDEAHSYDSETHQCICGKVDPDCGTVTGVTVTVTEETTTEKFLIFFKRKVTTYTYTINVDTTGDVPCKTITYQQNGSGKWATYNGEAITSSKKIKSMNIQVLDIAKTQTSWTWNGSDENCTKK